MKDVIFLVFSNFVCIGVYRVFRATVTSFISVPLGAFASAGAGGATASEDAAQPARGAHAVRRCRYRERVATGAQAPAHRTRRDTDGRQEPVRGAISTAISVRVRGRGSTIARRRCTVRREDSLPAVKLC